MNKCVIFQLPQKPFWSLLLFSLLHLCPQEQFDFLSVTLCPVHSYWRWFNPEATWIVPVCSVQKGQLVTCNISDKLWTIQLKTVTFCLNLMWISSDVQSLWILIHMSWICSQEWFGSLNQYQETFQSSLWIIWIWWKSFFQSLWEGFALWSLNIALSSGQPETVQKTHDILSWLTADI